MWTVPIRALAGPPRTLWPPRLSSLELRDRFSLTILSLHFTIRASLAHETVSLGGTLDADCARAHNGDTFMSTRLTVSFAALIGLVAAACASEGEGPNSVAMSESAKSFDIPALSDDGSQEIVAHAEEIKLANPEANLVVVQGEDGVTIKGDAESLRQLTESFETSESPQQKAKPRWCFQYGIERTGYVNGVYNPCTGVPLGPLCHSGLYWTKAGAYIDGVAWAASYGCSASITVKSGSCPATHAELSCW